MWTVCGVLHDKCQRMWACFGAATRRSGPLRRRGGRPLIGSGAASVARVRLEPELRQALASRAELDHETGSSVIRKALRECLKVA
jgi:hypothetical protein